MGARNSSFVRKVKRAGKSVRVIDFFWVDRAGRRQRYRRDATVQAAAAADAEAHALWLRATTTGTLDVKSSTPTFRVFFEGTFRALFLPRYRPSTRVRYVALAGQGSLDAFGSYKLDAIDGPAVRGFIAELLARGVLPRPHVNFVRTVLRAAVDIGVLAEMPALPKVAKQGRKLPDAPTDADVSKLLANASGWLLTAIALAVFAGLRQGEVRALEVRDVDRAGGRILVRRALSEGEVVAPKSGNERVIPLAPELAAVLATAMRDMLPRSRVVLTAAGLTPPRTAVLARLKALQARLGLPPRSFHQLRHYFCSALVRRGASVEAVRLLAGHSNLAITQRYVHAVGDDLRDAIGRLGGNRVETAVYPET